MHISVSASYQVPFLHREAKAKMQEMGGSVLGFVGAYYEDHVQPLVDSYSEWVYNVTSAMWEKVQTTFENDNPKKAN